jgi:2-keto-4-pentenoate hydratase
MTASPSCVGLWHKAALALASNQPSMTTKTLDAANALLDARRTATPIDALPDALAPTTEAEALAIQDELLLAYGKIGGWKVGAPSPDATPSCAPMPAAWITPNAAILAAPHFRFRGVEPELAFLLGTDLPPRTPDPPPYTLAEVHAAIASAHPALEVLESAFTEPTTAPALSKLADLQIHGAFVYGPALANWQAIDFPHETVTLIVDGSIRAEHSGTSASPAHFDRLLLWLANEAAARTGGLYAGQFLTTGAWTPLTHATANSTVEAAFTTLGSVSLTFA